MVGEATFELPADLPLGYHQLHLQVGSFDTSTLVIVSPASLELPARLGPSRAWGLATQLYSVRSQRSWGIGDLTDLTDLAVWSAAQHGAGFVLVNPLHAAAPTAPMEPSPYLPTSRRFVNPLYLRVEAIPEFAYVRQRGTPPQGRARSAGPRRPCQADRPRRRVEGQTRRAGKRLPRPSGRPGGSSRTPPTASAKAAASTTSPRGVRSPRSTAATGTSGPRICSIRPARRSPTSPPNTPTTVDFHRWLQWQLDDQLTAAQATAVQAGMELGIMHDLAVGVDPNGADAWALQDVLALGVTAGAPPDEFNQLGQDWSQPPWRPDQLVDHAYEPFRALVNAVLRHAGGVRIDHIIGLFRLWWIPKGAPPTDGTYVRYDHEAMIGIVALEAHRAGAVVVGEDLGTVEPWVRDYLRERGLFGTSILWFEADRDGDGGPLPAEKWREYCLSSVTTHDLPPTAGYLAGEHVRLREKLGLLTRPADEELAGDQAQQAAWLAELRRVGLLGDDPSVDEVVLALYRYLGRTPSKLLALSLADAVGDLRTQNQPGTTDEYPNWRVPLSGPDGRKLQLEDVFSDPRAAALGEAMKRIVHPPV